MNIAFTQEWIPISFGPDLLKTGGEAVFVYSHTIWNK